MNVTELKALVYDLLAQKQQIELKIQEVNQQIQRLVLSEKAAPTSLVKPEPEVVGENP
jgi:hypothetical protein